MGSRRVQRSTASRSIALTLIEEARFIPGAGPSDAIRLINRLSDIVSGCMGMIKLRSIIPYSPTDDSRLPTPDSRLPIPNGVTGIDITQYRAKTTNLKSQRI